MEDRDFLKKLLEKLQKLCISIGALDARVVQLEKSMSDLSKWKESWTQRCEQHREIIKASIRSETESVKKELKNGVREIKEDLEDEDEAAKTRVSGIRTNLEQRISSLSSEIGDLNNKYAASRQILGNVEKSLGNHLKEDKSDKRASASTMVAVVAVIVAGISALINFLAFVGKL